jgi:hypothetical protein
MAASAWSRPGGVATLVREPIQFQIAEFLLGLCDREDNCQPFVGADESKVIAARWHARVFILTLPATT